MDKVIFEPTSRTAVTTYDRVSSWLIATSLIVGALVWVFFLIWLTANGYQQARTIHPTPDAFSGSPSLTDVSFELQEPKADELPEISRGTAEIAVSSINEAVSRSESLWSEYDGIGSLGANNGDHRKIGPACAPSRSGAWERWSMHHQAATSKEYFQMLDQLGVSLGAVSQTDNRIEYLTDLSDEEPKGSSGVRADEKRQYFYTSSKRLKQWQRNLWDAADVELDQKIMVQFYSDSAVETLHELEAAAAERDGKSVRHVKRCTFGIESIDDEYKFVVEKIEYHKE